jgi:predicted MFS family arabinose efflux permease
MDQRNRYSANIPKFYLYTGIKGLYLWMPIIVIYLQQERQLSLTQVTLLASLSWIVTSLAEIPTGMVADAFGRKVSIVIGNVLEIAAILLYVAGPSYTSLLIADVLWGISISFFTGATDALLYDSLAMEGREQEYTRLAGRGEGLMQAAMIGGALIGGLIGAYDLRLPFIITAVLNGVTLMIMLSIAEPPDHEKHETTPWQRYSQTLRQIGQIVRSQPTMRYLLLYGSIVPIAGFVTSMTLLQPRAMEVGVPIVLIGVVLVCVRGGGMAGSFLAGPVAQRLGERATLITAPLVIVVMLVLTAVTKSVWGLAFIAAISLTTTITRPLISAMIQRQVPGNARATIISVRALMFTLVLAGAELMVGVVGDRFGLMASFLALALCIGLAVLLLFAVFGRLSKEPNQEADLINSPSVT